MGVLQSGADMSKMQNVNTSTIKAVAFTMLVMLTTLTLCVLIRAGISDYQARASERQAILDEAQQFKSHPLVLNGCETDLECERLDEMLAVINTSYKLQQRNPSQNP